MPAQRYHFGAATRKGGQDVASAVQNAGRRSVAAARRRTAAAQKQLNAELAAAAAGSMTVQQALDEAQAECEAQITLT